MFRYQMRSHECPTLFGVNKQSMNSMHVKRSAKEEHASATFGVQLYLHRGHGRGGGH